MRPVDGTATAHEPTPGAALYRLYVAALAVALAGNLAIRLGTRGGWLPGVGRLAVALLTAAPLVVAAVLFGRLLRRDLDEMLQRVVLEGMAFALVLYLPAAALYTNLRVAGAWTPRLDAPDVVLLPAFLVAVGIGLAGRRLR